MHNKYRKRENDSKGGRSDYKRRKTYNSSSPKGYSPRTELRGISEERTRIRTGENEYISYHLREMNFVIKNLEGKITDIQNELKSSEKMLEDVMRLWEENKSKFCVIM